MISRFASKKSRRSSKSPKTYAFIDASNLFYGGEKRLGWSTNDQKRPQEFNDENVKGENSSRILPTFSNIIL